MEVDLTDENSIQDVVVKEEYILEDNLSDSEATDEAEEIIPESSTSWQNSESSLQPPEDTKNFLHFEITELEPEDDQKPREKRMKCRVCDRRFPASKYHSHLRNHTDEQKTHCDICLKIFVSETSMRKHMKTIHECDICGGIFNKRKEMSQHILEKHKGVKSKNLRRYDVKPFQCEKCRRSFSYESHYVQHISASIDCARRLICPVCNMECKTQSTLTNHVKTHSTEKPFVCTLCDKAFKMKSHLESHVSTHMTRRISCPYCPKAFKVQKAVELHIQNRHRGLPPNPHDPVICCTICKQIYKSLTALMHHVRLHPKDKPYECKYCGKKMTAANYLKKHIETAHSSDVHNYEDLPIPPIKKEIV